MVVTVALVKKVFEEADVMVNYLTTEVVGL